MNLKTSKFIYVLFFLLINLMLKLAWAEANSGNIPRAQTQIGHLNGVNLLTWSQDGRLLASAGRDNSIKIWDGASAKLIRTLVCDEWAIQAITFDPGGKTLAVVTDYGSGSGARQTLCLYDLISGTTFYKNEIEGDLVYLVNYLDNDTLIVVKQSVIEHWRINREKGKLDLIRADSFGEKEGEFPRLLARTPSGDSLVIGTSHDLAYWDHASQRMIWLERIQRDKKYRLTDMIFSSDGRWLALLWDRRKIELWDMRDRRLVRQFNFSAPKDRFDFGLCCWIGFDGEGKHLAAFDAHLSEIEMTVPSLTVVKRKASLIESNEELFSSHNFPPLIDLERIENGLGNVDVKGGGNALAITGYDKLALADRHGKAVRVIDDPVLFPIDAKFPLQQKLVVSDSFGNAAVWDLKSGVVVRPDFNNADKSGRSKPSISDDSQFMAFTGSLRISGQDTNEELTPEAVLVGDVMSGKIQSLTKVTKGLVDFSLSSSGKWLAANSLDSSGSRDIGMRLLRLFDVQTRRLVANAEFASSDTIRSWKFAPTGSALFFELGGKTGKRGLYRWNFESAPPEFVADNWLETLLAVSPSSDVIAVKRLGYKYDRSQKTGLDLGFSEIPGLSLVRSSNGTLLRAIGNTGIHTAEINAAAFSSDERTLAVANSDGSIALQVAAMPPTHAFDASPSRSIRSFCGMKDGWVAIADDQGISVWSSRGQESIKRLVITKSAHFCAPDGDEIIVVAAGTVRRWRPFSGSPESPIPLPSDKSVVLGYAADGHTVLVVDFEASAKVAREDDPDTLRVWERPMHSDPDRPSVSALLPDGSWQIRHFEWPSRAQASKDELIRLSPNGSDLLITSGNQLAVQHLSAELESNALKVLSLGHEGVAAMSASRDTKRIGISDANRSMVIDLTTSEMLEVKSGVPHAFAMSHDGELAVLGLGYPTHGLEVWDVGRKQRVGSYIVPGVDCERITFSPDGAQLFCGSDMRLIAIDVPSLRAQQRLLLGHEGPVRTVRFSPDGKFLVSTGEDRVTILWDVASGQLLARLLNLSDGSWVVIDPDGRFDASDLDDLQALHWVMPDDPLTPLAVEIFMRDYYEPRLLPRILAGEKFQPVKSLISVNRVQPNVHIVSVQPKNGGKLVQVTVEVSSGEKNYSRDGKQVMISTAANDLQLFRDGQLVGYKEGQVATVKSGAVRTTFDVQLPLWKSGKTIEFSAYAFNDERVKSTTSKLAYEVPAGWPPANPRAVILTIGVNEYESPMWNLDFAANDARRMSAILTERMKASGQFKEVTPVIVISDADARGGATKANIRAALERLSERNHITGNSSSAGVGPDDLLLISFSGHGYLDDSGMFYLLPHDIGRSETNVVTQDVLARSISSDELRLWLRDFDVSELILIVDACNSAASVAERGFKPGPMGSRGLGQLAYDKGMRILAATQADDVALESEVTRGGLLSYALIDDGLAAGKADFQPKDQRITLEEWLRYAVTRVPILAKEISTGELVQRGQPHLSANSNRRGFVDWESLGLQQPSLFDFRKHGRELLLDRLH